TARSRTGGRSSACTGVAATSNARPRSRREVVGPLSHCGALLFAERPRPAGVSLSIIHLSLSGIFLDYSAKFPVESSPARGGPAGAAPPEEAEKGMADFVAAVPGHRAPLGVRGGQTFPQPPP